MKKMIKALVAMALAASLIACGPQPQMPQVPQQAQQVYDQAGNVVQQAAPDGFDAGDAAVGALAGAAAGYMMGNASGRNTGYSAPSRTIILDNRARGYGYRNSQRGRSVTTTTTTRRSMFGGTRTTTTRSFRSYGRRR